MRSDPNNLNDFRRRLLTAKRKEREALETSYDFTSDDLRQRKTRLKHRKKKHSSDDEGDSLRNERDEILPRWKLCLVVAAIVICFALLFPTVFSPMFNSLLGRKTAAPSHAADSRQFPQHSRSSPPSRGGPPVHPAAAAHMRMAQTEGAQSSGRGSMFTWMLPIYTVGVVSFLGYTLYKIMFKNKNRKKGTGRYSDEFDDGDDDSDSDSDVRIGGLGRRKMKDVQKRLRQTERAMREIVEQLENIASCTTEITQQDSSNQATTVGPTTNDGDSNGMRLNPEQMLQVERGLKELRQLNELYKEQKEMIDYSDENDDTDLSDNAIESVATISTDDETKNVDENDQLCDVKAQGINHDPFVEDVSAPKVILPAEEDENSQSKIENIKVVKEECSEPNGKTAEATVKRTIPEIRDSTTENVRQNPSRRNNKTRRRPRRE